MGIKTYNVRNAGPVLRQAHKCPGLNRLMESLASPLDNWIFNGKTYITMGQRQKPSRIRFHSKRPYVIITMNDNITRTVQ